MVSTHLLFTDLNTCSFFFWLTRQKNFYDYITQHHHDNYHHFHYNWCRETQGSALGSDGQPQRKWEDKDQWLARMTKMLCTYAVIMLQPQQRPLCLADAWAWLVHVVNSCEAAAGAGTGVSNKKKPPFFTAAALEVFLKVTAQRLHYAYGDAFMKLLVALQKQVLPQLGSDMPKQPALLEFLERFIGSGGRDFVSLFH